MKGFKLLALRPLKGRDQKILKNLTPYEIYKFYRDYEYIKDKNDHINQIHFYDKMPNLLFEDNISISAIVGKNGSGKSTLIELLSGFIFCFSVKLKLINIDDFVKDHELNENDQKSLKKELEKFENFNCELIYSINSCIHILKKEGSNFTQATFQLTQESEKITTPKIYILKEETELNNAGSEINSENIEILYQSFFYSILANYSLYGLNSDEIGIWLKSIFHKNDGYKTPIVLNPMRTKGVIDINKVTYLSKSRLLSNVFSKRYNSKNSRGIINDVVNGKIIENLILKVDFQKFNIVNDENLKEGQYSKYLVTINGSSIYLDSTQKWKKTHLILLIKSFYPKVDFSKVNAEINRSKIKTLTVEYILRKTETIIKKYSQYDAFSRRVFRSNAVQETIEKSFNLLAQDFSHRTFKLRQALNFLIYSYYEIDDHKQKIYPITTLDNKGISDIINAKIEKKLNKALEEVEEAHRKAPDLVDLDENTKIVFNQHRIINYLPPSFFSIDFEFKDKGFFKDLSSGEKQMIYSINSIIYHLINLESISSMNLEDSVSYKNFNIILDEVELCFHPEFQRTFISELVNAINSLRWHAASFNLVFLTHSPFILSDIPSANILMLEDGEMYRENNTEETYAANIHDLLANEFFLSNGFMGEYAKNKIQDLLRYLTFNEKEPKSEVNEEPKLLWNPKNSEFFIDIIGEPLLKYDLKELYLSKFYEEKKIDDQIEKLMALKEAKKKNDFN